MHGRAGAPPKRAHSTALICMLVSPKIAWPHPSTHSANTPEKKKKKVFFAATILLSVSSHFHSPALLNGGGAPRAIAPSYHRRAYEDYEVYLLSSRQRRPNRGHVGQSAFLDKNPRLLTSRYFVFSQTKRNSNLLMMTMAIPSSFASRLVLCIAPALSFLFVSSITTSYAAPIHLSPYDGRSMDANCISIRSPDQAFLTPSKTSALLFSMDGYSGRSSTAVTGHGNPIDPHSERTEFIKNVLIDNVDPVVLLLGTRPE